MIRGLAVTGTVITSAGIVLAGTFSALAVLPLVTPHRDRLHDRDRRPARHLHRPHAAGARRSCSRSATGSGGRRRSRTATSPRRPTRRLANRVAELNHSVAEHPRAGELHRPAWKRVVKERLAVADHDRDDGQQDLVEQTRLGVLRGDVAAAHDPDVAVAGGSSTPHGDRRCPLRPRARPLPPGPAGRGAQRPVRLARVRPVAAPASMWSITNSYVVEPLTKAPTPS